jgi:ABC-type transporter Mla subunit MlaD
MDRLFEELRQHQEEMIQALRKASLLVLAERDLRAKEVEQIKSDLSAIYEVLERNRQDRQNRIGELIR